MLDAYSTWLHTLPLWSQPAVETAIPCFAVLVLLMIRHRVSLHRRGERLTIRKKHPAEFLAALAIFGAVFYFRDKYPVIPLIMEWPDRAFPYYHAHGLTMWAGFFAAGFAARIVSALFAALFLRGSRPHRGGGVVVGSSPFDLLPDPPPGFGWYRQPKTRVRITRTRTASEDE